MSAIAHIKRNEGYRPYPYRDHLGNWTMGWGRNVERMGIANYKTLGALLDHVCEKATHEKWLEQDVRYATESAKHYAGEAWEGLSEARQDVLIEMAYQLGGQGLRSFKRLQTAVKEGHWVAAEAEILDSRLAEQTPERAKDYGSRMLEG